MRVLVYKGRAVRCWPLAFRGDETIRETLMLQFFLVMFCLRAFEFFFFYQQNGIFDSCINVLGSNKYAVRPGRLNC